MIPVLQNIWIKNKMVSVEKSKSLGIKTDKICPVCKNPLVLITSFDKQKCKSCYLAKEHKQGHSGMLSLTETGLDAKLYTQRLFCSKNPVTLIKVPKGDKTFSSLYLSHYPQSKGIVGRTFNYLVLNENGFVIGIIGACSPPIVVTEVDKYFNINFDNRLQKLEVFLNNNIFRLVNTKAVTNLGSRVLKRFRTQLQSDYYLKYGKKLKGLISFVEPPRKGTVYLADNWDYLGKTKGYHVTKRGKMTDYKKFSEASEDQQKHIFGYKFKSYYDWE